MEFKDLPEMTHKTLQEFVPVRLVNAMIYSIFSLIFGGISTMVWLADIGPFYGAGWLSVLAVIGLPLGLIALLLPMTMPRSDSRAWRRFISVTALLGIILSILGTLNILTTMMDLVP